MMTNEYQTNRSLMSELAVSSSQPSVPSNQCLVSVIPVYSIQPYVTVLVVRSPSRAAEATGMTFYPPDQATVATAA